MNTPLGKGVFLIAKPALRDPNFCQTVVLLCEHGPEGALGVVVNRPTEMNITEVLPQVPVIEGQPHRVFSGGPFKKIACSFFIVFHRKSRGPTPFWTESILVGTWKPLNEFWRARP